MYDGIDVCVDVDVCDDMNVYDEMHVQCACRLYIFAFMII